MRVRGEMLNSRKWRWSFIGILVWRSVAPLVSTRRFGMTMRIGMTGKDTVSCPGSPGDTLAGGTSWGPIATLTGSIYP